MFRVYRGYPAGGRLVTANTGMSAFSHSGFGGGGGSPVNRYSPVYDDLSRGTVAEDWIPKDVKGQNRLWRWIFLRGNVEGPTVDLYKELPWSDFILKGIEDEQVLQVFQDSADALHLDMALPELCGEYLVMGRFIAHLLMDESKGYWTDMVIHDPDYAKVGTIPITNMDPKVDLLPSPAMRAFISSADPRDVAARRRISPEVISLIAGNRSIPLSPENTIYLPRKAGPNDYIGTSLYSRVINFVALEKALVNGTLTAARRWLGPRLHIVVGKDQWEPSPLEMNDVHQMFMQAEEDPVGAVITTKDGVQVNPIEGGKGHFWTLEDSWSVIQEGKMRALGVSEAFLSGDATYNNMEHVLSIFFERVKALRDWLSRRFVVDRMFRTLARAHGFYKRDKAQVQHQWRRGGVSDAQLMVPDIKFTKQLKPQSDTVYLDILDRLEAKGLPIGLRDWAAAGAADLDAMIEGQESDLELREKIRQWKEQAQSTGVGQVGADPEQQDLPEASDIPTIHSRLEKLPIWRGDSFVALTKKEAAQVVHDVLQGGPGMRNGSLDGYLRQVRRWNTRKAALARYVLARLNLIPTGPFLPRDVVSDIVTWLSAMSKHPTPRLAREMMIVGSMASVDNGGPVRYDVEPTGDFELDFRRRVDSDAKLPPNQLLTGYQEPNQD